MPPLPFTNLFLTTAEIRQISDQERHQTTDNALYVTANSFGVAFGMYINPIEVERPLYVSYDYIGKFSTHWFMANGSGSGDNVFWNVKNSGYDSTDTWKHVAGYRTADDACKALCKNTGFTRFGLESATSGNPFLYADNIKFIPAYKVTYLTSTEASPRPNTSSATKTATLSPNYTPNSSVVDGARSLLRRTERRMVVKPLSLTIRTSPSTR